MQTISYFNPLFYAVNGVRILVFNTDFMPETMSNMLVYSLNFGFVVLSLFALITLGISIMVFSRVSITEVIKKLIEETEDMI
jgi:ABC-type polysaccharide/polyol phosphate export permease